MTCGQAFDANAGKIIPSGPGILFSNHVAYRPKFRNFGWKNYVDSRLAEDWNFNKSGMGKIRLRCKMVGPGAPAGVETWRECTSDILAWNAGK